MDSATSSTLDTASAAQGQNPAKIASTSLECLADVASTLVNSPDRDLGGPRNEVITHQDQDHLGHLVRPGLGPSRPLARLDLGSPHDQTF